MNLKFYFLQVPLFVAILLNVTGCRNERQVVPYEVDPDIIFKALQPNDENMPEGAAYGPENTPGFTFDNDFVTDNNDVYIYFVDFTVLDINPAITENLFDFILQELDEFGFIKESDSLNPARFNELIASGISYKDASANLLDDIKADFERKIAADPPYGAFNINFLIYPVYLDRNYVTYRESLYCYTGGAHGISVSYLYTYDIHTGRRLTVNDMVKKENLGEVREEVAAQMAYSYPIYENITTVNQYLDSLNLWLEHFAPDGSDRITLQNFPLKDAAVTSEGLAFMYQMYELTPGADGCPLVVIPYEDIKGCLKINLDK